MAVKKIDHVSILTTDPESVIAFYRDFLGFRLESTRRNPKMFMNIFDLKKDGDFIEIIEPTSDSVRMSQGIKHIAFLSDNIDEDFEFFRNNGASMIHNEIQRQENAGFFFVKSPSGEFVEIIQYAGRE